MVRTDVVDLRSEHTSESKSQFSVPRRDGVEGLLKGKRGNLQIISRIALNKVGRGEIGDDKTYNDSCLQAIIF